MDGDIKIKDCICCWYDLLGYGAPFIEANWDLNDPRCKINIQRIEKIKMWFLGFLSLSSQTTKLHFNDGSISNIDVDINCDESLYSALFFLETIINDYIAVNDVDQKMGFPGVRGVLTCGHRFDYDCNNTAFDVVKKRTVAYHPREFQMNTAFSKAYIIEDSGSKAGIKGPNLYIDKELFILFQKAFKSKKKHSIKVQVQSNELIVKVIFDNKWFATIIVDSKEIIYENKGINTKLYQLKRIESKLADDAKEAALQQSLRYALMEKSVEE